MSLGTPTHRSELVSLLRGYFACPVVAALADLGVTGRMRAGPFEVADFPEVKNPGVFRAALRYLHTLGVLEPVGDVGYRATALGEYVLGRTGAFHLLRSYRDYFDDFARLLADPSAAQAVHRLENVHGTGQLHARKFFPTALAWLRERPVRCVVDVGCGSGVFLADVLTQHPAAAVVGVDLSADAVAATAGRLGVRGVVANASDVPAWADAVPDGAGVVVAIWFVLHEFSNGDPDTLVRFFQDVHARRPRAEVIVGEIVAPPPGVLAASRSESVYPELLLFHALSGQGVLAWDQHQEWLRRVPYRLAAEQRFDELPSPTGSIPSSIVWHLAPR